LHPLNQSNPSSGRMPNPIPAQNASGMSSVNEKRSYASGSRAVTSKGGDRGP